MSDSKTRKYVETVVEVLELGADHLCTKKELKDFMQEQGIEAGVVHLTGSNGLFEPASNKTKLRLNVTAMSILLSHRSIKQANTHALWAMGLGIVALIVSIVTTC